MKTATYEGRVVALLQKTSHKVTRIADTFVKANGALAVATGLQLLVPTADLQQPVHTPREGKQEFTPDDLARLNAARGLNFHAKDYRDKRGLKPALSVYNAAILRGIYTGSPIEHCV